MQLTEKQKYEIVVLYENHYNITKIATKMNINRKTVMKWINRYRNTNTVKRKKGSGGRKVTSNAEDKIIIDLINKDNDLSINELKTILEGNDIYTSYSTIYKRLIDNNYIHKFPIKKPVLTEIHRKNRLKWAKDHLNTKWNKVIFSDEAAIRIGGLIKRNGCIKTISPLIGSLNIH